ncbi:MAG TPA: 3-methyl-2-oxobutanoate dehydrogenase subunit VorB [Candidatus Acidoferrum sp.]|nr:3-methyl-2-oxobutanoate dehydrogenase subunit VorB [Candidatus Acidoferrum sp.]
MERELWKGNEAIAQAAISAGCRGFFGYPITPQNEIPEYMSQHMEAAGGVFVQSESEIAAINMVYGASAAGVRAMTSSSSPGISLKQEGISYLAGAELPAVIVNMVRGGPGLGTIQPSQGDYFQSTRGGGNGDYRTIALAPCDIEEAVALTEEAFDLADRYRNPVLIVADGVIGQMMEPVAMREPAAKALPEKSWAASGRQGREHNNFVTSLALDAVDCEAHNLKLLKKYREIEQNETRWESYRAEDAALVIVAYGTVARIAKTAIDELREKGVAVGMLRPVTLWPFPTSELARLAALDGVKSFLTVEMSTGQMLDDVKIAVEGRKPVRFFGRTGGMVPAVAETQKAVLSVLKELG